MSNGPLRDHRDAAPPRIKYAPQFSGEITSVESRVPSSCALRCDASLRTVRNKWETLDSHQKLLGQTSGKEWLIAGVCMALPNGAVTVAKTGRDRMVMEPVSVESAIEKAKKKGLKPGRVKGTDGIRFTKGRTKKIEVISWNEFRKTLRERRLQVYESSGSMKIVKRRRRRP